MKVPTVWHSVEEIIRKISGAINQADDGNLAVNGEFTCTPNQSTTVVKNYKVGIDSVILFMPLTENAAQELHTHHMYVTEADISVLNNQFTVNHRNNTQTDRHFRYIVIGQTLNTN